MSAYDRMHVEQKIWDGAATYMKVRDVIKLLEADGWRLVATKGSHRQYEHPSKKGVVTVPGHFGDDMPPGTLASVFRQAKLKRQ